MQLYYHFFKFGKDINNIKTFNPQDTTRIFNNIIFPKQSPLAPIFSHSLLKLHEEGLIKKAVRSYTGPHEELSDQNDTFEVLSMGQCILGFVVLGSGMLIMIMVMVIECCFAKCLHIRRGSIKNKHILHEYFQNNNVNVKISPKSLVPKKRSLSM